MSNKISLKTKFRNLVFFARIWDYFKRIFGKEKNFQRSKSKEKKYKEKKIMENEKGNASIIRITPHKKELNKNRFTIKDKLKNESKKDLKLQEDVGSSKEDLLKSSDEIELSEKQNTKKKSDVVISPESTHIYSSGVKIKEKMAQQKEEQEKVEKVEKEIKKLKEENEEKEKTEQEKKLEQKIEDKKIEIEEKEEELKLNQQKNEINTEKVENDQNLPSKIFKIQEEKSDSKSEHNQFRKNNHSINPLTDEPSDSQFDSSNIKTRTIEARKSIGKRKVNRTQIEKRTKNSEEKISKKPKKKRTTPKSSRPLRSKYLGKREVIETKRQLNSKSTPVSKKKNVSQDNKNQKKKTKKKDLKFEPKIIIDVDDERVNLVTSDRIIANKENFDPNNLGHYKITLDGKEIKITPHFVKNKKRLFLKGLNYSIPTPFKEIMIRLPRSLETDEQYHYFHSNPNYYVFIPDVKKRWKMHWLYDEEQNFIPIPRSTNRILILYNRDEYKDIDEVLKIVQEDFSLTKKPLNITNKFQIDKQFWQGNFLILEIGDIKETKFAENIVRKTPVFKLEIGNTFKDNRSNTYPMIFGRTLKIKAEPPSQIPINIILQHSNKEAQSDSNFSYYRILSKGWSTEEPINIDFPKSWPCGNYQLTFTGQNDHRSLQTYHVRWIPELEKNFEIFKNHEHPIFPSENGHISHDLSINLDTNIFRIKCADHSIPIIAMKSDYKTVDQAVDPCKACKESHDGNIDKINCNECTCISICSWGLAKLCPFSSENVDDCPYQGGDINELDKNNTRILFKKEKDRVVLSLRKWKSHTLKSTVPYSELELDITIPKIRWRFSNEDNWNDKVINLTKKEFLNSNKQSLVIRTNIRKSFPFSIQLYADGKKNPLRTEKEIISPSDTKIDLGYLYGMMNENIIYYIVLKANYEVSANSPDSAILMRVDNRVV
ncbi:hypothetical protein [Candidatus Harpocratesius sp.]